MKKTKRLAALIMAMMCLFGLLAGLPVSAAAISADTALTASMAAANPNVQLKCTPASNNCFIDTTAIVFFLLGFTSAERTPTTAKNSTGRSSVSACVLH